MRIGADTGGTFTDLVADDGRIVKVPSTPNDPAQALAHGIDALFGGAHGPALEVLAHGTTVATNTLLERSGARVALVTTAGFADVIEIARQVRPSLYDQHVDRPEPLVARQWRYEAMERMAFDGTVLVALDASMLPELDPLVEAVAVCFLHADLFPEHERIAAAHYRALGYDVTASHEVSPEFREYERTVTTVANAYLRPRCRDYLETVGELAARALVMTSAGGLVPVGVGAEIPASLVLSGPAGGVRAAAAIAAACGIDDVVTFDMGGTSTDVCLVRGGVPDPAPSRVVAGMPVRLPALDIHTIGAGGGSIVGIDAGGALTVGPQSAGAVPGPACYRRGGTQPTVTDADLVLGRIPIDAPFPGLGVLDRAAAVQALDRVGVDAAGVVAVVDTLMAGAVRRVTVERGIDARDVAIVAFGGAGPLHACGVADLLGVTTVVVPPRSGVLSAVGLLCAPEQREVVVSALGRTRSEVEAEAASRAAALLPGEAVELAYDCRYRGQSHEITVPSVEAFDAVHERYNGYAHVGATVEVIAVRARVARRADVHVDRLPVVHRASAVGPAVVAEPDCTIWIPPDWTAAPGPLGALLLHRNTP